ncbi:hypothetical protein BOS5A_200682 [Bosea sp. EC-HK365B]|nr:hypothetical protein BOSE46_120407 [Bosea sp. 46]VVT58631.1 hypothetical protein BOS5A_200682 [Bosea sp. EC-HK365B]
MVRRQAKDPGREISFTHASLSAVCF